MKRFYKDVSIDGTAGAYAIHLDGRAVKTPQRAALTLPTETLAAAIAQEWRGQGEEIIPASMPLTKLANTALDRVTSLREEVVSQIMAFANDTLCYRAASPVELVARQAAEWDPVLNWIAERYGVRLQATIGIAHLTQSEETLARLKAAVAAYDDFMLAGLHMAAGILTSLSLTLALGEKHLSADAAFALSQLDERYQAERWGEDEEAAARTRALLAELLTVEQFLTLVRG